MFGDFNNFNIPNEEDEVGTDKKHFDLESYADYMKLKGTGEGQERRFKLPEELKTLKNNKLKIVKFSTNKHKIPQRQIMEDNIIPQHPSSVIFNGRSGSGKSNLIVNLLTRPEFYGRTKEDEPKSQYFDLIFLFSPTAKNDDLPQYLEIPDSRTFDENFDAPLEHIIRTQKNIIEKNGLDSAPKILIIFDDIQSQKKFMNSPNFTKMFIQNRHHGISTWVACQSFTRLPRVLRLQANALFIFPSSGSETEILAAEFTPPNTSRRQFETLIQHATRERFSFLFINMREPPDQRYRKNLDTILTIKKKY